MITNDRMILLVEDNVDDEALTLRALDNYSMASQIVVAHDGEEALEFLFCSGSYASRNPAVQPRVVLLDLKLPKRSGFDVLHEMRTHPRTRRIPVVVLTSSTEQEDLIRAYNFGANSFVRKPVELAPFITAVRQLGLYWLTINSVESD